MTSTPTPTPTPTQFPFVDIFGCTIVWVTGFILFKHQFNVLIFKRLCWPQAYCVILYIYWKKTCSYCMGNAIFCLPIPLQFVQNTQDAINHRYALFWSCWFLFQTLWQSKKCLLIKCQKKHWWIVFQYLMLCTSNKLMSQMIFKL